MSEYEHHTAGDILGEMNTLINEIDALPPMPPPDTIIAPYKHTYTKAEIEEAQRNQITITRADIAALPEGAIDKFLDHMSKELCIPREFLSGDMPAP